MLVGAQRGRKMSEDYTPNRLSSREDIKGWLNLILSIHLFK